MPRRWGRSAGPESPDEGSRASPSSSPGAPAGTCSCSPAENSTSLLCCISCLSLSVRFPPCGRGPSHGFQRQRVHGRETPQVHTCPSPLVFSQSLEVVHRYKFYIGNHLPSLFLKSAFYCYMDSDVGGILHQSYSQIVMGDLAPSPYSQIWNLMWPLCLSLSLFLSLSPVSVCLSSSLCLCLSLLCLHFQKRLISQVVYNRVPQTCQSGLLKLDNSFSSFNF